MIREQVLTVLAKITDATVAYTEHGAIVVGYKSRDYLMLICDPAEKLTQDQQDWHDAWRGQVCIVRSTLDALAAIGAITPEQKRARSNFKATPRWGQKE